MRSQKIQREILKLEISIRDAEKKVKKLEGAIPSVRERALLNCAINYNEIGMKLRESGEEGFSEDFLEAITYHRKEKQVAVDLGRKLDEAVAERWIAENLASLGDYKEARKHAQKHIDLTWDCDEPAASTSTDLQLAHHVMGEIKYQQSTACSDKFQAEECNKSAVKSFIESLNVLESPAFKDKLTAKEYEGRKCRVLLNLAKLYTEQDRKDRAVDYFQRCCLAAEKSHDWSTSHNAYYFWSLLLITDDQLVQSLEKADRALTTADKSGKKQAVYDCLILIGHIHVKLCNFEKATAAFRDAYRKNLIDDRQSNISQGFYGAGMNPTAPFPAHLRQQFPAVGPYTGRPAGISPALPGMTQRFAATSQGSQGSRGPPPPYSARFQMPGSPHVGASGGGYPPGSPRAPGMRPGVPFSQPSGRHPSPGTLSSPRSFPPIPASFGSGGIPGGQMGAARQRRPSGPRPTTPVGALGGMQHPLAQAVKTPLTPRQATQDNASSDSSSSSSSDE